MLIAAMLMMIIIRVKAVVVAILMWLFFIRHVCGCGFICFHKRLVVVAKHLSVQEVYCVFTLLK